MNDKERYFNWLCSLMDPTGMTSDLMKLLFELPFMYQKSGDEARAKDGLSLRTRYLSESENNELDYSEPCSVLEMMVALAFRAEDILYDPSDGTHAPSIFWQMVMNMGIMKTENDQFDYYDARQKIFRMMGRRYTSNGKGGLFRIPNCKEDLREVELWYQMLWYVNKFY